MDNDKDSSQVHKRVRKIQATWTHEMTMRLIELVESREAVWNFLSNAYRDRNARETAWAEISEELGLPRSEVTAKWNSIRGSFRATHIKLAHTNSGHEDIIAKNLYYKSLHFLEPALRIATHTEANFTQFMETDETLIDLPEIECPPKKICKEEPYDEILGEALGVMRKSICNDSWDAVGNLVTTNGRELARRNPRLSSEFKCEVLKLVSQFEEKSLKLFKSSEK